MRTSRIQRKPRLKSSERPVAPEWEQLSFLDPEPKTETAMLWESLIELKESHRSVQRRLFSEISDLKIRLTETQAQIEVLKDELRIVREQNLMFKLKAFA